MAAARCVRIHTCSEDGRTVLLRCDCRLRVTKDYAAKELMHAYPAQEDRICYTGLADVLSTDEVLEIYDDDVVKVKRAFSLPNDLIEVTLAKIRHPDLRQENVLNSQSGFVDPCKYAPGPAEEDLRMPHQGAVILLSVTKETVKNVTNWKPKRRGKSMSKDLQESGR